MKKVGINYRSKLETALVEGERLELKIDRMTQNNELEITGGTSPTKIAIGDLSTYIDPVKFNYIFADTSLEAMNFWIQTKFDIKARRLISAKQIPNL